MKKQYKIDLDKITNFKKDKWLMTCLKHCTDFGISELAISLLVLQLKARNEQSD